MAPMGRTVESNDPGRNGEARDPSGSQHLRNYYLLNLLLPVALCAFALAPMVRISTFGMSASANAFRSSDEKFWLTSIAVGWVLLLLSVEAVALVLVSTRKGTRRPKIPALAAQATLAFVVFVLITATWFFANDTISDAVTTASAELADEGNPFASIVGNSTSIAPDFGFWAMLAVALGMMAVNVMAITQSGTQLRVNDVSEQSQSRENTVVSELVALTSLLESGALSQEEFESAKQRVLENSGDS
jgi:hypothetical protein